MKKVGVLSKDSYLSILYKGKMLQYKWPLLSRPFTQNKYFDSKGIVQCRFDNDLFLHIIPTTKNILDEKIQNSCNVIHLQGQLIAGTNTSKKVRTR